MASVVEQTVAFSHAHNYEFNLCSDSEPRMARNAIVWAKLAEMIPFPERQDPPNVLNALKDSCKANLGPGYFVNQAWIKSVKRRR